MIFVIILAAALVLLASVTSYKAGFIEGSRYGGAQVADKALQKIDEIRAMAKAADVSQPEAK